MDRRQFLHSAKFIAAGAGASSALATVGLAASGRHPEGAPVMRRFNEQRWALDNMVQAARSYQAKWLQARLAGKPFTNEYSFVEPSGKIDKRPL